MESSHTKPSLLPRESLQATATIIQTNIMSIQGIVDENYELFQRIAIHPSTNYPGRTQQNVLNELLRKLNEPEMETVVEQAIEAARAAGLDEKKLAVGANERRNSYDDDLDDYGMDEEGDQGQSDPFSEQWADCRYTFEQALKQYITGQAKRNFTVEEQEIGIENVRTGLKRKLTDEDDDEEEEDEDEDEDEEMGMGVGGMGGGTVGGSGVGMGGGPAGAPGANLNAQPENLLWLLSRGGRNLPKNIEFAANRVTRQETKRPPPPR